MSKTVEASQAPHVPTAKTRSQVERLAACGLTPEEIAFGLELPVTVVKSVYAGELAHGLATVTGKVASALVKQALRGDVAAQTFWLRARARWTPAQHVEVTGKGGGPVQVEEKRKLVSAIVEMVGAAAATETATPASKAH
jgi:hypothetical protein